MRFNHPKHPGHEVLVDLVSNETWRRMMLASLLAAWSMSSRWNGDRVEEELTSRGIKASPSQIRMIVEWIDTF